MKKFNYKIFTIIALIAVFTLQIIWLYNSISFYVRNVNLISNAIIKDAMEQEKNIRFQEMPHDAEIVGPPNVFDATKIPEIAYWEEGMYKVGFDVSLSRIDSIVNIDLKQANINSKFVVCNVNKKNQVIAKSKNINIHSFGIIKTDVIPIRINKSQGIQLCLVSTYRIFFEQMGLLLIASLIIALLIIYCIIQQIQIIIRQNNIAKIRKDFSYAMIHDMKSPLATIMNGIKNLQSGKLDNKPEVKNKSLKLMWDETSHLLMLINKVLTISKIEEKKLSLNKTNVQIEPMVKDIAEKYISKARKTIHFSYDIKAITVFADGEYIKEALSNLIDNAIKYSKDSVDIRISSEDNDNETTISVHDNGLGISEKDKGLIFEKFERASALGRTNKGGATGFGLGLNYVMQVIEAHGGRVSAESELNKYSEFTIYIPKEEIV